MTKLQGAAQDVVWRNDGKAATGACFAQYPNLLQASTTRAFQAGLPPEPSRIQEIEAACQLLGCGQMPFFLGQQKHTTAVEVITPDLLKSTPHHHTFPFTDALVTAQPNAALVIQTADCAPIFLYDPTARVIGLAHAGWKGTLGRIAQATVQTMISEGASPDNMVAFVGPMAGSCCYEVSPELIENFRAEFSELPPEKVHEGRQLNLVQINLEQLSRCGLRQHNIFHSGICTIHNHDQFCSYRADNGTTGRILSILAMLDD